MLMRAEYYVFISQIYFLCVFETIFNFIAVAVVLSDQSQ